MTDTRSMHVRGRGGEEGGLRGPSPSAVVDAQDGAPSRTAITASHHYFKHLARRSLRALALDLRFLGDA